MEKQRRVTGVKGVRNKVFVLVELGTFVVNVRLVEKEEEFVVEKKRDRSFKLRLVSREFSSND